MQKLKGFFNLLLKVVHTVAPFFIGVTKTSLKIILGVFNASIAVLLVISYLAHFGKLLKTFLTRNTTVAVQEILWTLLTSVIALSWIYILFHIKEFKGYLRIVLDKILLFIINLFNLLKTGFLKFKNAPLKQKFSIIKLPVIAILLIVLSYLIYPYIKPPKIIYTYPDTEATEVPLNSTLEIVFDKPVNKKSAEDGFYINPPIEGKISWESDSRMVFTPSTELSRSVGYTVGFSKPFFSKYFVPSLNKHSFSFTALGNPKIALYSPSEATIDRFTPITIVFDRPMIPITTVDEKESYASPIVIEPALKGAGRWLGTTAYQYVPSEGLAYSTRYTVTVAPGLKSIDGGEFAEVFSWQFVGEAPRVVSVSPDINNMRASVSTAITITFNQKIDLASFKENFVLKDAALNTISGSFSADSKNQNILIFKPQTILNRTTGYTATVSSGLKSTAGTETMQTDYFWNFSTIGYPSILSSNPANYQEDVKDVYGVSIYFLTPMSEASLEKNITIDPKPEYSPNMYFSEYNNVLSINFSMQRSTAYKINISKNATDIYGYPLGTDYTLQFKTAPYDPAVSIEPSNRYFAAFNTDIRPIIVSKVVNSPNIKFNLYKLTEKDFIRLHRLRYDYDFASSICADNYPCRNWRNYDTTGFQHINTWEENIDGNLNVPINVISRITGKDGSPLESGIYFLDIRGDKEASDNIVLILSKSSLTIKRSEGQAFVWAVNQMDAEPASDMNIKVYSQEGELLTDGVTNSDGVWKKDINLKRLTNDYYNNPKDIIVTGTKNNDFVISASNWDEGIENSSFGYYSYDRGPEEYKLYITLDSPIYRPGETINYKGLIRKDTDGKFEKIQPGSLVEISIFSPDMQTVHNELIATNSFGSFWGSYKLAAETPLGYYVIKASYQNNEYQQQYQVEEYRKPEFSISIQPNKNNIVRNTGGKVIINASYYFGAPLSNTQVNWTLKRKDYYFSWEKQKGYDFTDDEDYFYWYYDYSNSYYGDKVTEGSGYTDLTGNLSVSLPSNIPNKTTSQELVMEAQTQDINNQVIAGSNSFVMHAGDFYIGLKPRSYVNTAKQEAKIDIVTVGLNHNEVPGKKISTKLYRRTWNQVREMDQDTGEYYYVSKTNDVLEDEVEATTNDKGYTSVTFVPNKGGTYKILAQSTDTAGNTIRASTFLWVTGMDYEGQRQNNDRINLISDKQTYFVGDTAKIFSDSPYSTKYKSLFTIERNNVIEYFLADAGGDAKTAEFKISANHSPNVYVGVVIPKPGDSIKNPPEFKMGYLKLDVTDNTKKIILNTNTDKKIYKPGEAIKVNINTKTAAGTAIKSEVLLGVVDKAEWDLSNISFSDIYKYFYGAKTLKVSTSNLLTISMDRINANTDLGSKGGSGGGGGESPGFFDTSRNDFLKTAFWKPDIITDDNGNAYAEVPLPDNLTTWKIIGVASDGTDAFGSSLSEIITSKDIIVRPFLPRFVSSGDNVELGAILLNKSGNQINGTVEIKSDSLLIKDESIKNIKLANGEQKKITWNVDAQGTEKVKIGLGIKDLSGTVLDAVDLELPIKINYILENNATSGETSSTTQEKIVIPADTVPNLGNLNINIYANPANSGLYAIDYMNSYPYECSEQAASKLISAANVLQIMNLAGIDNISGISKSTLQAVVNSEIQTLLKRQHVDGGWSWWEAEESPSDLFISTYVYHALTNAKNIDNKIINVPDSILQRGRSYLTTVLASKSIDISGKTFYYGGTTEKSIPGDMAVFIMYAMEDSNVTEQYAPILFQHRNLLSIESKAYLATAMHSVKALRPQAGVIKREIESLVRKTNNMAQWQEKSRRYYMMGSDINTTAAVLTMYTQIDHNSPLVKEIVRHINNSKNPDNSWVSTRTTAQVLEALNNVLVASGGYKVGFNYKLELNGEKLTEGVLKNNELLKIINTQIPMEKLSLQKENLLNISKSGLGTLYYDANLKYYLPFSKTEPKEQGITLIREFVDSNGKKLNITSLDEGSDAWVKLTAVVPDTRYHIVLEDFLPAGLESVNTSLKNSEVVSKAAPYSKDTSAYNQYYFGHHEFRDDRTVYFADILSPGIYEILYKVRATTPGNYQYPPARIYDMYNPDIFGSSAGDWFDIRAN